MSSIDLGSVSRGARLACRTRRWMVGLAFAVLLLLHVGACQVLLAPTGGAPASTPSAAVTACQHGTPGHDLLCQSGASVAVVGQRLAPRDFPMTPVDLVLVVLVTGLLGIGAAVRAWTVHGPPGAQRLALWGRDLLQSVGLARI